MSIPFRQLTPNEWEKLLISNLNVQSGNGIIGYRGLTSYQRGYGIGSFFRSLFRMVRPVARRVAKTVAKEGLESAALVGADILEGENVKSSIKKRSKEGANKLMRKAVETTTTKILPKMKGYDRLEEEDDTDDDEYKSNRKPNLTKKQRGKGMIGYKQKKRSINRRKHLGFGKKERLRRKFIKSDYLGDIN